MEQNFGNQFSASVGTTELRMMAPTPEASVSTCTYSYGVELPWSCGRKRKAQGGDPGIAKQPLAGPLKSWLVAEAKCDVDTKGFGKGRPCQRMLVCHRWARPGEAGRPSNTREQQRVGHANRLPSNLTGVAEPGNSWLLSSSWNSNLLATP